MKLVINTCFGGFELSPVALARYAELKQFNIMNRNDPCLVQVVEELGEAANTECSKLEIVEIPDGINWSINNYDGKESVESFYHTI